MSPRRLKTSVIKQDSTGRPWDPGVDAVILQSQDFYCGKVKTLAPFSRDWMQSFRMITVFMFWEGSFPINLNYHWLLSHPKALISIIKNISVMMDITSRGYLTGTTDSRC